MESASKIFVTAISVFHRRGFGGLISYIKKFLAVNHVELAIFTNSKNWNWPTNKIFHQIKIIDSKSLEFAGATVELPFFVSSSESIPIPLAAYKVLREHNFKGCYITSAQVAGFTALLGCFSEEPLKLTDSKIQVISDILTQALNERISNRKKRGIDGSSNERQGLMNHDASGQNYIRQNHAMPEASTTENPTIMQALLSDVSSLGLYALCTDAEFNILHLSGDVYGLTGYKPTEIISGQVNLDDVVEPTERKRFLRIARSVIRSGLPKFETFRILNSKTNSPMTICAFICSTSSSSGKFLLCLGLPAKHESPKIELFNLESLRHTVELIAQLASNPVNFKTLISTANELFRSLVPAAKARIFAAGRGPAITPILGNRSVISDQAWSKITEIALKSKLPIVTYKLDRKLQAVILRFRETHSPLFFIYVVGPEFEIEGYRDTLEIAIKIASTVFEASTTAYSQAHFMRRQRAINKELSKLWSLKNLYDLGQKTLEIATSLLPSLRGWIGVVNSQRTHLEGIGGFGPGVGLRVSRSQVELILRHDYLDDAIKQKKCQIVPAGTKMECSGFNEVIKRLNVGLIIIQPIMHETDVIGVLILEPMRADKQYIKRVLPLLDYLSFYVGLVINALRFEYRVFEADKMKTISVFSAGLAHYLNNIFQSVIGNLSLVEQRIETELKDMISRSLDATRRGASLVRRLNEMAGPSTKAFELVDINQLILENRELYTTLLEPNVELDLDLGHNLRQIVGSKGSIQQALLNVILNAKEAIEDSANGKVTVKTREVKLNSNQVDPLLPPGRYVEVRIADNGRGMTEDELHSCFEPFFSTKSSKAALWPGLGLATTYSIMRAHGGLATASSTPGLGTEITLYFPYPLTAVIESNQKNRVVYIHSDDQKLVTELRSLLNSLGKDVALLESDALFKNSVILLDLDSETAKNFDTRLLDTCSVIGMTQDREKANAEHNFPVILKPVSIWKLAQIIE